MKSPKELAQAAGELALKGVEKAGDTARPAILRHIEQSRRAHPDASPEEIIKILGHRLTAAVATSGAAVGGVAAAPAVGTGPALAFATVDAGAYTTAAGLYVLALAEIYGVPIEDVERRRTLIMGVLLGDSGAATVTRVSERTGGYWGKQIVAKIPVQTLRRINKVLGPNFVTKYGTKQGILVLGKAVPFGLGAIIGGGGNAAFAQFTIRSARRAFGPPPEEWGSLDLVTAS